MKYVFQQYLDNVAECHRLAKANRFPASESENRILEQITNNAQKAYQLRLKNDEILNEIVFSKRAEELTVEEVQDLQEFTDSLLTYVYQNDVGIAYRVHKLLFEYAQIKNDLDLYIKELYHMGISLFYLSPSISAFGINMNGNASNAYLREGASYLDKIEQIESETTRAYIIRCVANLFLTDENINGPHNPGVPTNRADGYEHFRKLFGEIRSVMESSYYREMVPHFDWDSVLYNLHFNRCLYYFNFQRSDLPHIVDDMLESAEYIYKHKKKASDNSTVDARIDYLYVAVKRRAGLAEVSDIVDVLLNAIEGANRNDYSANGVTLNLQLPLYLEYTFKLLAEEEQRIYGDRVTKIIANISRYLKNVPFNAYNNVINGIVAETIRYYTQLGEPVRERLFEYLLCCHTPTYIHVRLAASLGRKLFERIIETAPQKAVGVFGICDIDEILARKDELAKRVYDCTLYHDVGKIMLLEYVEIYNRKLLEEEYKAICLHPHIAAQILQNTGYEELPYIALYHHCYYDGSGGYPINLPPCPTEYKLIAEIASVIDSIEAATDNVGRCYSAPKSFKTIIDELRNERGTRYSPDVVDLFDDPEFFDMIRFELDKERRETYIEIYREKSE